MAFIPGIELARLFYREAVRPILESDFPNLIYSAALLGSGSEVLGFDTEMSTDHSWGPRLFLFLQESDHETLEEAIRLALGYQLPLDFRGFYTHYETLPEEPNSHIPGPTDERPIHHRVVITTLSHFLESYTGSALDKEITLLDWLLIPEQKLRTLVAGGLFHDGLGTVEPLRQQLAWYPHDVWLYLLSAQWQRIGQEEPFVGRTGIVGDETGSAVLASRLVRDLMRLCLLLERQYAPYPKWFGTGFSRLACAPALTPIFTAVHRATNWQERESHLITAYEYVAEMHNRLRITPPIQNKVSYFHNRPFQVIDGGTAAEITWQSIQDTAVRTLPFGLGKVDQYVDSTDILSNTARCRALENLYRSVAK
ncbi:MAG: DUF4037 domain-containing protein [Candidatus Promineifilaceae bacterium]